MPLLEFTLIQHANLSKHIVKETEQYAQEHYTEYGWWFWETMSTKLAYGHSVVADFECYKVRWMLKGSLGGATIKSLEIWSTNMFVLAYAHQIDYEECRWKVAAMADYAQQ